MEINKKATIICFKILELLNINMLFALCSSREASF